MADLNSSSGGQSDDALGSTVSSPAELAAAADQARRTADGLSRAELVGLAEAAEAESGRLSEALLTDEIDKRREQLDEQAKVYRQLAEAAS
jgi:hypothetical protein